MAKKTRTAKARKPTRSGANVHRAIDRSMRDVKKAQKTLDLKLKKHSQTVASAMFFSCSNEVPPKK